MIVKVSHKWPFDYTVDYYRFAFQRASDELFDLLSVTLGSKHQIKQMLTFSAAGNGPKARRPPSSPQNGDSMSIKDEIEKLICAEQEKIEARDNKHADYHQRKRDRFVSLRAVLKEITESIDSKHLESRIGDESAIIEIGRIKGSYRSTDIFWRIEPNYGVRFGAAAEESLFYEEPGFKVEETVYYIEDMSKNDMTFPDEKGLAEYLIEKITKQVAHYRHLEWLEEKRKRGH